MSIQKPSIAVVSEIDPDAAMVTLVNQSANSKVELECVKADDSDLELLLRAVYEYWNLRTDLGIHNSCSKTFSLFRQVLTAEIRSEWDMIKQELAGNTVGGFCEGVDILIARYIDPNGLQVQKRYLETYQLPVKNGKLSMKVSSFAYRLRFLNKLMALFPGAPPSNPGDPVIPGGLAPYNEQALKAIMFNALPVELQDAFNGSGRDPHDPTVDMLQLARQLDIQCKAVVFKTLKSKHNDSSTNQGKQGKGGRRGGKGSNRNNSGKGKDCPYHPGKHKWSACFANPDGNNYKGASVAAKIIAKAAEGATDGSGGSGRRRNHSETNAVEVGGGKGSNRNKKARTNDDASTSKGTGNATKSSSNEDREVHWIDSIGAGGMI